jgi:hypothetical protein
MLIDEPKRAIPNKLAADPMRTNDRTLITEPTVAESKVDKLDPKRTIPNADTALPKRAKDRTDKDEPK